MQLDTTPVTYNEAIEILNSSRGTLNQALAKGRSVLTKLPRTGKYQYLMRGQVMLFRGKQLSLSELNQHDRELWQQYRDHALGIHPILPGVDDTTISIEQAATDIVRTISSVGSEALKLLSERRIDSNSPFLSPVVG